jgi:hypothetical protein
MNLKKLDEIIEHAELIQKLTTLLPVKNKVSELRINSVVNEAEMIIQLARSLQERDE